MSRYGFVHLEFGAEHRGPSMEVLGQLRAALMHEGDTVDLVIVDNASVRSNEIYGGAGFAGARVLEGDNSNRQFTGWDKGIASLLARGKEPDSWIFTNDTIARHHVWSEQRAARFGAEIRRLGQHPAPWLLGEINDFPRAMTTPLGLSTQCVATYCFAMNQLLRQRLDKLSPGNMLLDSLVYDGFEPEYRIFRDHVDPVFVEFVSTWMIQDDSDPDRKTRHRWARERCKLRPLGARSFDDLRMKARCYMSEAMLSARALQLGAAIRSPCDAPNARDRLRKSLQYLADTVWEKHLLRRLQQKRPA